MSDAAVESPWRSEALDLVRAMSGGLLFGVPLLFTMEVWWTGELSPQWALLVLVALLGLPVFVLNKTEGFRSSRDVRWRDAAADAIEAVALAFVVTAVMLVLIREIRGDVPLGASLGKVIYESVPFCLGIGMARHLLSGGRDPESDDDGDDGDDGGGKPAAPRRVSASVADLGATLIGSVFIALSIAPTDEVPMIASAMTPPWLLLMVAASLAASYAIVFVAGFGDQDARHAPDGPFQRPITETVTCYLIALLVSVVLLWAFQRAMLPWPELLAQAIVLALPAAIGGAAGRLAV